MDNDRFSSAPREPRQMFEGQWECGKCKAPITQLPFQPNPNRPLDNLLCKDCFKEKLNSNRGGFGR